MAILTIFIVGYQRIHSKMHSFEQVMVGLFLGIAYTMIYTKTDLSYISILILLGIIIFLTLLVTLYVDNIIQNDPTPEWVDKNLYSIIEKKKNIPFYYKLGTTLSSSFFNNVPLYIDYKTLIKYLDMSISKIQESNISYDAIVGIKSGGAILSNYIANKLNIKNYYVKTKKNIDECNSNEIKYLSDTLDTILRRERKNVICEGIDDNIENKNVILIDEQIYTGTTIDFIVKYLLNEKKVANIFVITLTSKYGEREFSGLKLQYINQWEYSYVYPWGYDN
jgi:hypoxanthine phosphoribosyltransferase